jgi:hypothetical protein
LAARKPVPAGKPGAGWQRSSRKVAQRLTGGVATGKAAAGGNGALGKFLRVGGLASA